MKKVLTVKFYLPDHNEDIKTDKQAIDLFKKWFKSVGIRKEDYEIVGISEEPNDHN